MAFMDSSTGQRFATMEDFHRWFSSPLNPRSGSGMIVGGTPMIIEVPDDPAQPNFTTTPTGALQPQAPTPTPTPASGAADTATNSDGFDLLKRLATGVGPTEAGKYSLQQNLLNRQDRIDASTRQGAGAMAGARSALAARGGVGSGARERLAQVGADNQMMAKQGAYRDSNASMLDILKGDQGRRDQALQDFTKLDLSRWATGRQADALEKSAGQSGGGGK